MSWLLLFGRCQFVYVFVCAIFFLFFFQFIHSLCSAGVKKEAIEREKKNANKQTHVAHRFAHIICQLDNNHIQYKNAYCPDFFFILLFSMDFFFFLHQMERKGLLLADFSCNKPNINNNRKNVKVVRVCLCIDFFLFIPIHSFTFFDCPLLFNFVYTRKSESLNQNMRKYRSK